MTNSRAVTYLGHGSYFLEVSIRDLQPGCPGSLGNNDDLFEVEISTLGSQPLLVRGREVEKLKFTITGPFELDDFFESIADVRRQMRRPRYDRDV
jgi:hypothetical protein